MRKKYKLKKLREKFNILFEIIHINIQEIIKLFTCYEILND